MNEREGGGTKKRGEISGRFRNQTGWRNQYKGGTNTSKKRKKGKKGENEFPQGETFVEMRESDHDNLTAISLKEVGAKEDCQRGEFSEGKAKLPGGKGREGYGKNGSAEKGASGCWAWGNGASLKKSGHSGL